MIKDRVLIVDGLNLFTRHYVAHPGMSENGEQVGGIVGFSGKLINLDVFKKRIQSRPPILLIHGDADQVVPPSNLLEAKDFFIRYNIEIETHLIKNCDHHIPIEASSLALNYILKKIW